MKYLIIIGETPDFDQPDFRTFLKFIMEACPKKPFKIMLYNYNGDILKAEYPYLTLVGDTKKHLALYPNILLKNKDIGDIGLNN